MLLNNESSFYYDFPKPVCVGWALFVRGEAAEFTTLIVNNFGVPKSGRVFESSGVIGQF